MLARPAAEHDGDAGLAGLRSGVVLGSWCAPTLPVPDRRLPAYAGAMSPTSPHAADPPTVPPPSRSPPGRPAARARQPAQHADHDGLDVRRRRRRGVRPLRQPDLDGVRGGARRPRGRPLPGVRLRAGRGRHDPRPRRPGRARWSRRGTPTTAASCSWPTSRRAAGSPRALVDITDTDAVVEGLRRRRAGVAGVADQPGAGGGRPRRRSSRPRTRPAPTSWSTTPSPLPCSSSRCRSDADLVVHSATKFIAGHSDVLLGAVVTARRRALRRAEEAARPDRRDARARSRPGSRCAGCAPCTCGSSGRRPTRRSSSAGSGSHPAVGEVRYPGFGAIVAVVLRRGRARRRPADPQDHAVGARHQPRRRRVDVRAAPPLEDRAGHHPRRAGPDVGRHRGRRRPLGRPGARALDDLASPAEPSGRGEVATRLGLSRRVSRARAWSPRRSAR